MRTSRMKWLSALLCVCFGAGIISIGCLASPTVLTFEGTDELGYTVLVEHNRKKPTGTQKLTDADGNHYSAYCIDSEVNLKANSLYTPENAESFSYIPPENIPKIRAILQNSYPYISLAELQRRASANVFHIEEAITATQIALWHYTNGKDYPPSFWPDFGEIKRINKLKDWYLSLEGAPSTVEKAAIIIRTEEQADGVHITYYADERNISGSAVALTYAFSTTVTVRSESKDPNGVYHLLIDYPREDVTFTAEGTQALGHNVVFLAAKEGLQSAQSMACVTDLDVKLETSVTIAGAASEVSSECSSETSSEISSEVSSECSSEISSEIPSEVSSECSSETSSEISSEVSSEYSSETSSEISSEVSSECSSEISSEIPSEVSSECSSEISSEIPSEVSSEYSSETSSEISSEVSSECSSEISSEIPSEVSSECSSDPSVPPTGTNRKGVPISFILLLISSCLLLAGLIQRKAKQF